MTDDLLIVLDNCGPHKTTFVRDAFIEAGWKALYLPPNMTDILQPMDLVVNSMVKSFIRNKRIDMTMNYFHDFRNSCQRIQERDPRAPLPSFNPPAPVLLDGLNSLFQIKENFNTEKFRSSVKKVFLSVGLTPFVSTASDSTKTFTFQNYAGVQTSGAMKKEVLSKADKNEKDWLRQDLLTVGGILVDTEMRSESQISQLEEHISSQSSRSLMIHLKMKRSRMSLTWGMSVKTTKRTVKMKDRYSMFQRKEKWMTVIIS